VYKLLGYLTKRDGMSTADFIDHYENRHVPLILSLATEPLVYKRHYLVRDTATNAGGGAAIDFDVVTELGFADRDAYTAWLQALTEGDSGARVAADEERFLDRSRTRSCAVEDHVTSE
jgi:hypothetical protein